MDLGDSESYPPALSTQVSDPFDIVADSMGWDTCLRHRAQRNADLRDCAIAELPLQANRPPRRDLFAGPRGIYVT